MSTDPSRPRAGWRARALIAFLVPVPAAAQIPSTYTNLKVLPKNTSKADLVATMRAYNAALGVRCSYCHVGEEGRPYETWDFASDANSVKETSRLMMQMTQEINANWLARTVAERKERVAVTCATCHHGRPVPRGLADVLRETLAGKGAAAAVTQYRELRRKYYGRDAYDFGEPVLSTLAQELADDRRVLEAIALLELNVEFHPESAPLQAQLGAVLLQAGQRERAIAAYRRAVGIDPGLEVAKRKLEELQARP